MALVIRTLSFLAALLLATASNAHAYKLNIGDAYVVPAADRVSAKQLYARDAEILSAGKSYIELVLSVPGRVYMRHVENATAVAAGVFGRLRASGDTSAAVKFVDFPDYGDDSEMLQIFTSVDTARSQHKAESLLLDIEFYQRSVLKSLTLYGSADVVILGDVLYNAPVGNTWDDVTELRTDELPGNHMKPGNVFISDPKARFSTNQLSISTKAMSTVQLDVAALSTSVPFLVILATETSGVKIFAPEMMHTVAMGVKGAYGEATARSRLCVAAKHDVDLSVTIGEDYKHPFNSTIAGGSACGQLPVPPREPSLIGDEFSVQFTTTTPVSFAPGSSHDSATTPSSSASMLVGSSVLVVLVAMLHAW